MCIYVCVYLCMCVVVSMYVFLMCACVFIYAYDFFVLFAIRSGLKDFNLYVYECVRVYACVCGTCFICRKIRSKRF